MKTPICDFVQAYIDGGTERFHMPGHKGTGSLGIEAYDLTEIKGADSLFDAEGIILESEENAARIFGSDMTLYSCEGSSLGVRTMLVVAKQYARIKGRTNLLYAGRNTHKTFVGCAALLDSDVVWLHTKDSYLSGIVDSADVQEKLEEANEMNALPAAVYITSPDYLGNCADLKALAEICHRYEVLLLVDNAHGAYLHFLKQPCHPMDLGADLCCDSAHKTLPVLTGGAYVHVSEHARELFGKDREEMLRLCKHSMALFASTSPSYLILQSLDHANRELEETYGQKILQTVEKLDAMKGRLKRMGYSLVGQEPMKLTIDAKTVGVTGIELAEYLRSCGMECEFSDPDYLVCMVTPHNSDASFAGLEEALCAFPIRSALQEKAPGIPVHEQVLPMKEALFAEWEEIPVEESVGRIVSAITVGCPPAVPIVMIGERILEEDLPVFRYYGIPTVAVMKL